jgi:hypothetical protein
MPHYGLYASLRPLPTQTGDVTDPSPFMGMLRAIRHIKLKDVGLLIKVVRQAVSGELTNDKEYIMERVIQVCEHRKAL